MSIATVAPILYVAVVCFALAWALALLIMHIREQRKNERMFRRLMERDDDDDEPPYAF